jgi:apolipoprotein N-acyltransferase
VDANLPRPIAPTVYARAGDGVALLIGGVALAVVLRARRRRRNA